MSAVNTLLPLTGILVIMLGFILRVNPMFAIIISALTSTAAAKMLPLDILTTLGNCFIKTRNLSVLVLLPLAMVGLMERNGLREKAQLLIGKFTKLTASKLLVIYLLLRQLSASVGLNSLGGQAQMVRPILAPMVEQLAINQNPQVNEKSRETLKALAAATDNVGLFFGEDIFVAFGAVALMSTFMHDHQIKVEMLQIALWGIPSAIFALVLHGLMTAIICRKQINCRLDYGDNNA